MRESEISKVGQYTNFAGVLIGFCVTLVTILLALSGEGIKSSPYFEYAIGGFIGSTFFWIQTCEWFAHYVGTKEESKKERRFYIASYCYYCGYLAMTLSIVYLLKLFNIRFGLLFSYIYLLFTVHMTTEDLYQNIKEMKDERKSIRWHIFALLVIMLTYFVIIFYTLRISVPYIEITKNYVYIFPLSVVLASALAIFRNIFVVSKNTRIFV